MRTFAARLSSGSLRKDSRAPRACWAQTVRTQETAESKRKGIFSASNCFHEQVTIAVSCEPGARKNATLPKGQESSNKNSNGKVTSIGLVISPRANRKRART